MPEECTTANSLCSNASTVETRYNGRAKGPRFRYIEVRFHLLYHSVFSSEGGGGDIVRYTEDFVA